MSSKIFFFTVEREANTTVFFIFTRGHFFFCVQIKQVFSLDSWGFPNMWFEEGRPQVAGLSSVLLHQCNFRIDNH